MNKFREVLIGTTLAATSLGVGSAIDSTPVDAANHIEQGIYEIPSNCNSHVGEYVSLTTEKALISVGFPEITADNKVTSIREQGAVLGAQKFMKEIGVIDKEVTICGLAGPATLAGVRKMQTPNALAGESQISSTSNNVNTSNKKSSESSKKYTIDDCRNYDLWSEDTIKAVQAALGVRPDGNFGNVTCNAMIEKQIKEGIDRYGKGSLGDRTLTALDVHGVRSTEEAASNSKTDIDRVVIDKSDNTLKAYENGKLVEEVRTSHGDDRNYTFYVNGRQYTGTAITRTGTTKVYRTEGADYASRTLGGAPGSMGYARFFNGGLAVHVGNIWSSSHGCVRVSLTSMKNLVKLGFGIGDTVVVQE